MLIDPTPAPASPPPREPPPTPPRNRFIGAVAVLLVAVNGGALIRAMWVHDYPGMGFLGLAFASSIYVLWDSTKDRQ